MDRFNLKQQIQETERQLETLRRKLLNHEVVAGAEVGSELEDGSIILVKGDSHTIVVCPEGREFQSSWYDMKFKAEQDSQFDPEWFIPSKDLLMLAHQRIPQFFFDHRYWSSSELIHKEAHIANVKRGFTNFFPKGTVCSVRPFRILTF